MSLKRKKDRVSSPAPTIIPFVKLSYLWYPSSKFLPGDNFSQIFVSIKNLWSRCGSICNLCIILFHPITHSSTNRRYSEVWDSWVSRHYYLCNSSSKRCLPSSVLCLFFSKYHNWIHSFWAPTMYQILDIQRWCSSGVQSSLSILVLRAPFLF